MTHAPTDEPGLGDPHWDESAAPMRERDLIVPDVAGKDISLADAWGDERPYRAPFTGATMDPECEED